MAAFHLQREAEADILEIGRYTEERWGREQRVRYAALDKHGGWFVCGNVVDTGR